MHGEAVAVQDVSSNLVSTVLLYCKEYFRMVFLYYRGFYSRSSKTCERRWIMEFQHELIIPNEGFPFKIFLFEGGQGNYEREKHWHTSRSPDKDGTL